MAYTIQYLVKGQEVWETPWESEVPPTRDHAWRCLFVHQADTAVIRDELGNHLIVITETSH